MVDCMKERYVEWDEPAYDKDGVVINQTVRMKADDAARLTRIMHPDINNDLDAIMEFMTIHWATIKYY